MRKIVFIPIIFLILLSGFAFIPSSSMVEEDLTDCLKKYRTSWDTKCIDCKNDVGTFKVCLKNECNQKIDVMVCVQEMDKTWRKTLFNSVAPNDSVIAFACNGTGKHRKWVRRAGDKSQTFPSIEEINKLYKD